MIEAVAKAAETLENSKLAKSNFDPDKKLEKSNVNCEKPKENYDPDKKVEKQADDNNEQKGLTQEQKDKIKEETGWSDEIIDAIGSMEEYQIYKDAGLIEAEIDGRKCLINPNIDMDQKDAFGRTNKERMEQGLAPLDKNGNPIELHHIGQKNDSPLAELTQEQHRSKENYSILHDTKKDSEIDRKAFDNERENHWKARAEGETNEKDN